MDQGGQAASGFTDALYDLGSAQDGQTLTVDLHSTKKVSKVLLLSCIPIARVRVSLARVRALVV